MKYIEKMVGFESDDLISGDNYKATWVVGCESSAQIERGELLSGASITDVFKPVSSAADAQKVLLIASAANVGEKVACYASGEFNRSRIKMADGLDLSDFEEALRKENIFLRGGQDA